MVKIILFLIRMLSIHPEVLLNLNSPGGSIMAILSTKAVDFTSALSILSYYGQYSQLKTCKTVKYTI